MAAGKDYLDKEEVERLRRDYPAGAEVKAVNVLDVPSGTIGIIKEVKYNGVIEVLWSTGIQTSVVYGVESILLISNVKCLIEKHMAKGACDGTGCETCGWNKKVAAKRVRMVKKGLMETDQNGVRKLVIRRPSLKQS